MNGAPRASRKSDEIILSWLRMRGMGWGPGKIARLTGVGKAHIARATLDVRRADERESGETITDADYWRPTA